MHLWAVCKVFPSIKIIINETFKEARLLELTTDETLSWATHINDNSNNNEQELFIHNNNNNDNTVVCFAAFCQSGQTHPRSQSN